MEEAMFVKKDVMIKMIISLSILLPGIILLLIAGYRTVMKAGFISSAIHGKGVVISVDTDKYSTYNSKAHRREYSTSKYPLVFF